MMTDLTQSDIDNIIQSLGSLDMGFGDAAASGPISQKDTKKVKIYDFKRPDKFSKEQMRTVQNLHESFSRLTTTSLSAQLRCLVEVKVASTEQLTYEEFTRSVQSPAPLAIINMDPLKGSAILHIDTGITFAMIDRLFGGIGLNSDARPASSGAGGGKSSPSTPRRELTDIESSVMEGIILRILGNMREAWSQIIELRPRLSNIDSNVQFIQIVPPNEMVILVTLEVRIKLNENAVEGMMSFCIPYLTIEPIVNKLSTQFWYSTVRRSTTTEYLTTIKNQISGIPIPLVVELGRTELLMSEIVAIKPGDLILFPNSPVDGNLVVKVVNQKKYLCRPGLVGNKVAVQITKVLAEGSADLEELTEEGEEL